MPSAKLQDMIIKEANPVKEKNANAQCPFSFPSATAAEAAARGILASKMQTMTRDLISSLSVGTATATTTSAPKIMGKKHVDDVIKGLEEWNAKWFEELVNKVKDELTSSAEDDIHSLSSAETLTPQSVSRSNSPALKPFQPTVEDCYTPEDEFELGRGPGKVTATESSPMTSSVPAAALSAQTSYKSHSASSMVNSSAFPSSTYSYGNAPLQSHSPSPRATRQPLHERPSVRFSDGQTPLVITHDANRRQDIIKPQEYRTPSTVDLRWGRLFNEGNEPTPALGIFLRGIANYMIAEYSPTDSLVIPPDKLYKLYAKFKLEGEVFPFQRVFDTQHRKEHQALEGLYLDLGCEYHKVSAAPGSRPCIPALTPIGFQTWMTLFIRAFPDREAKRLDLIAADLPIVADGPKRSKPETLPRQISRRLFPDRCHTKSYDLLNSSFSEWRSIAASPESPHLRPIYISSTSSSASSSPARKREQDYRDVTGSKPNDAKTLYKIRYERGPTTNHSHSSRSSRSRYISERDGDAHSHFPSREPSPLVREKTPLQLSRRYKETSPSCGRPK